MYDRHMYHFLCRCSRLQALSTDRTDIFWTYPCVKHMFAAGCGCNCFAPIQKVPGTVESCDVLESLLKMFTEPNRPKTRRTWKQGRRKRTVCSTVPLVSERILGNIFDYVGQR